MAGSACGGKPSEGLAPAALGENDSQLSFCVSLAGVSRLAPATFAQKEKRTAFSFLTHLRG